MSASATQGGHNNTKAYKELESSANTKRDGLPAEYRWRPLFCCAMVLTYIWKGGHHVGH